jgi:sugar/nucleoside kinase (ribokinase family)
LKPIAIIGNVNVDLIMGPAAPWPQPGTEIIVDHDELRVGGCAGNSALALDALGVDYELAASVGDDGFGKWLAGEFPTHSGRWTVHPVSTTVSVGITHPDGERTFFTTVGHLPHYGAADVAAAIDGERCRGGYALVVGVFLMTGLDRDFAALAGWLGRHDVAVALDTGWPPAGWTDATLAIVDKWLPLTRVSLFNEIETTSITGVTDLRAAAKALAGRMAEGAVVVVKRGPHGALAYSEATGFVEVAAPKVTVIDTIGAGDVFNAGFMAALAAGESLETCLGRGVEIASLAVSTYPRRYRPADAAAGESR